MINRGDPFFILFHCLFFTLCGWECRVLRNGIPARPTRPPSISRASHPAGSTSYCFTSSCSPCSMSACAYINISTLVGSMFRLLPGWLAGPLVTRAAVCMPRWLVCSSEKEEDLLDCSAFYSVPDEHEE